jgi:hypothetical protein
MPLHIRGNKTIGSMTERQRVALGALLTRHPQPDRLCGNDAAAKRR